jgi:acyl carrier protein
MNVSHQRVLEIVQQFVAHKQGSAARPIAADTPLLRDGHLDSFALVELIAEIERQLPATLPDGSLIPEDFETPRTLCERLEQL